ncbi:Protein RTM1 [Pseudocercospora fuligena]|uniref:Protein RTM1 n=1 Tax=Pseudocercospora fuligena TaxID=685502 RepID=A0A8H6RW47_9PEZI|nr:Protein RTM1 [Pseudocercospora fuligena]
MPQNSTNSDFNPYTYQPSSPAAILFTILFVLTTLTHLIQTCWRRTWFMTPFILGGICEIIGYISRSISASENPGPYSQTPYIIQTITIIVAPTLLAASIYMLLGRIVLMLKAEEKLFIRRTWLTKIFVSGDIVSFLMQGIGAGVLASASTNADPESANTGKDIIVGGLFVQIIFFGLFVIAAGVFYFHVSGATTEERPWKKHMIALYFVSAMIFVRSIVRVVEFLQGNDGYISTHEVFLYVFDAMIMWFAMVVMNLVHPGQVAKFIREDERQEIEKATELTAV